MLQVYCSQNEMAHAQRPDFVFLWNGRFHLTRCLGEGQFSRLLAAVVWRQLVAFVLWGEECVPRTCDVYWIPTLLPRFIFNSPPACRRVPRHTNRVMIMFGTNVLFQFSYFCILGVSQSMAHKFACFYWQA